MLNWYTSASADDENHDQEVDLCPLGNPGGAVWATVAPDGRDGHQPWLWEILDRWLWEEADRLAYGETETEEEAKTAVEAWVKAHA